MKRGSIFAVALALSGAMAAQPVSAQMAGGNAQALRQLDIMLMVSALRCRMGDDDFQSDYERFSARHLRVMNQAGQQLQADYAQRHGERAARRHLDTISTTMANRYGLGHPWLDCAGLAAVTRSLSSTDDQRELLAAADELLADRPPASGNMLARYGR